MIKVNNRNILRILLMISFVIVNMFLLFGISNILEYLNTGADRRSMLHLDQEIVHTYLPKITWQIDEVEGREIEPTTLKKVETDYLLSWYIRNKALERNKTEGISDYYTENSKVNLFNTVDYNLENDITVESTTLKHNPKLEFFSDDGQQLVFTDRNVKEFQKVFKNKNLIAEIQEVSTYKVMMLLEDGFWRIRHMQKMDPEPFTEDTIETNPDFKVVGSKIKYDTIDFTIKGINYYPKNSAWDTFGEGFDRDTIAKDFDIIKAAKLNSIRIFIQYEDFGKADVSVEKMEKLKILLDLAEEKGLKVIVTLFDFYSDYRLESWTLTQRHAEKIVTAFKNHKAIIAWDIKNEPNLDFENRGKKNVLEWLEEMILVVKEYDPNHLVTIGWSNSFEAVNLKDEVDFISYHFYNHINDFEMENSVLENATKKPVVVQEFGVPSYKGMWNLWRGHNIEEQADYYKQIQSLFKKHQVAFMSWTLYDFPSVPDQVAGRWPWQKKRQRMFGFIDSKGVKKPSFDYISY